MKPAEYEQLVADIANDICRTAPELQGLVLGRGRNNKLLGASGYRHQIDVSLQEEKQVFLIECKHWNARVGVAEVLVMAGRARDIQAHTPNCTVTAVLVSVKGASRGAHKLAQHFGVEIEIAKSASEFGLRIGRFVHQAVSDDLSVSDHWEVTIIRNGVDIDS